MIKIIRQYKGLNIQKTPDCQGFEKTSFYPLIKGPNGGSAPDLVIHLPFRNTLNGPFGGKPEIRPEDKGHLMPGIGFCPVYFFCVAGFEEKFFCGGPGLFKTA